MKYNANPSRYNSMVYNRVGNSGLILPAISLGLWHNFGDFDDMEEAKSYSKQLKRHLGIDNTIKTL